MMQLERMAKFETVLSVIITAHHEGELLDRTVKNILRCADELGRINVRCDFWINVDDGNEKTLLWAKKYKNDARFKLSLTNFGDVGRARNEIIRRAKGKYLALIDADDIVSQNWLAEGMRVILKENRLVVLHPEIEMRFDEQKMHSVNIRTEYEDSWRETLALLCGNRWCSIVLARKEIFLKHPYPTKKAGFGYEDYAFNCAVVQDGVKHLIVPNTAAFCLQKQESISSKTHKNNDVLPYSELFDLKKLQQKMTTLGLPRLYFGGEPKILLPDWAVIEAKKVIKSEKMLEEMLALEVIKDGSDKDLLMGELFCSMFAGTSLILLPKTLVFTDNLKKKDKLGWRELAILTNKDNGELPKQRNVVNFYRKFGAFDLVMKETAITRLIVQTKAKEIVVNEYVDFWIKRHQNFLKSNNIRVVSGVKHKSML